jgi:plasmid maintenance system antidote protein VapI
MNEKAPHPGEFIRLRAASLGVHDTAQKSLARGISEVVGLATQEVEEILEGRRSLNQHSAAKLARISGETPSTLLKMQDMHNRPHLYPGKQERTPMPPARKWSDNPV